MARALLDHVEAGLLALAADGRLILANEAARAMLGLDELRAEFSGQSCARLDGAEQTRLTLLLRRKYHGPLTLRARGGLSLLAACKEIEGGTLLLSFTPQPGAGTAASEDPATGLADTQGFRDRLAALCTAAPASGIAVVIVELERFAAIPDAVGDTPPTLIAERLRAVFRDADVIGRLGADAFAIAMPAVPDLPALTQRLFDALRAPDLGASIGIAFSPRHGTEPDMLLRTAKGAVAEAKAEGRNTVRIAEDALDPRNRTRNALAEDLRRAIPLQQLELHYQPIVSLEDGKLLSCEALVRWNHPRRGQLLPAEFIPLAEEMGLIQPLGDWVLREACRAAAAWPVPVTISVNVSPKQLTDRDRLPNAIAATLVSTGLPASRLEIEVTETVLARDAAALQVLHAIRDLGVQVCIDDFGTGYASLTHLRRFPFHKLKIDRTFISGPGRDAESAVVVRALAALGRSMGMATVAEGVETRDQKTRCREAGCTQMQGHLVSAPVPAADLPTLLTKLYRKRPTLLH